MANNTLVPADSKPSTTSGGKKPERLHYLDWLQVIAVLGVVLFHAMFPFDDLADWNIKSAEKSVLATLYSVFFTPWGMAFFFLMSGTTSGFSLRRRTPERFIRERVAQLLIPFIIGCIVLTPIHAYYELTHRGWWKGNSIIEFVRSSEARTHFYTKHHPITAGPETFGQMGYHLWFVAFLFLFSLIALPLFMWLKGDSGKRFVASLARLAQRRGGLLVFVIPPIVVRFTLNPFFPDYTGWSDFFFHLSFFISGYILVADERFMPAIRRDWRLYLTLGIACKLLFFSVVAGVPVLDWMESPGTPEFYVIWAVFSVNAWSWSMVMFCMAMRFLDFTNKWLQYNREASFPLFWVHHPVSFFVAFYVVQWEANLSIKMLAVVIGTFGLSLGLYELLVKRVAPVRKFFGMKPRV